MTTIKYALQLFMLIGLVSCAGSPKPSGNFEQNAAKSRLWNQGAQLARVQFQCGRCHSPQDKDKYDVNAPLSGRGSAPDLTGLTEWKRDEILNFFATGANPSGRIAASTMKSTLSSLKQLNDSDKQALAEFLLNQ